MPSIYLTNGKHFTNQTTITNRPFVCFIMWSTYCCRCYCYCCCRVI